MGFSCGDDHFNKKEKEVLVVVVDESSREARDVGVEVEVEVEFWPVEHPSEPQDEDRPVKCPIPAPSSLINESRMQEECLGRRAEVVSYTQVNKEGVVMALQPPVRKRHHTLTQDQQDHTHTTINPLLLKKPPLPTHNTTIFHMLQQFDN